MSQVVVELPYSTYSALMKAAQERGTTPADWIASNLQKPSAPDFEERVQGLAYYLGTIATTGEIAPATTTHALKAWNDLHRAMPALPVPDAAPGGEGQLLYTWDKDEHHLVLEIFPDSSAELFYYNRRSEEMWGYDYQAGDLLTQEVVAKLSVFLPSHE